MTFSDLKQKQVINTCDGAKLGSICDLDLSVDGHILALIVPGPCRFFGLFGRGEEFYVPWECIRQIGDDIILIDQPPQRRAPYQERKKRRKVL